MKYNLRRNCFLLWLSFFSSAVFTTSAAQQTFSKDEEVTGLKALVSTWANSVRSFSGSYILSQSTYEYQGGNIHEESSLEWRIDFRQEGENFYFGKEDLSSQSLENDIEICSQYNGVSNTFTRFSGSSLGVANDTERSGLPFTWGVYLVPQEILGHRGDYSLSDILAIGSTSIILRDKKRILSHVNPQLSSAVDITLDSDNHVMLIEWCRRPLSLSEEKTKAVWKGDVFDLRIKKISLELSDHKMFDGVQFPTKVVKTWWRIDEAVAEQANSSFERGKISEEELKVLLYSVPVQPVCVQTFLLESAVINTPLSEKDFVIDWPKGVRIIQARDMPDPGEIIPPESRKWPYVVAALVCTGVIAVVIAILYRKRRP